MNHDAYQLYMQSGDAALEEGKPGEALPMYQRAVEVFDPKDHGDEAFMARRALVEAARRTGNEEKFASSLDEMIRFLEGFKGKKPIELAGYLRMKAFNLVDQSREEEAVAPLKRAAEVCRKIEGSGSTNLAALLNNLGLLLRNINQPEEALAFLEESVLILHSQLGEHDEATTKSKHNLAEVYMDLDQFERAAELHRQVLVSLEDEQNADPDQVIDSLNALAGSLRALGKYGDAVVLLEQAEAKAVTYLGGRSLALAVVHDNLGQIWQERGDLERAQKYLGSAFAIYDSRKDEVGNDTLKDVAERLFKLDQDGSEQPDEGKIQE